MHIVNPSFANNNAVIQPARPAPTTQILFGFRGIISSGDDDDNDVEDDEDDEDDEDEDDKGIDGTEEDLTGKSNCFDVFWPITLDTLTIFHAVVFKLRNLVMDSFLS